MKARRARITKVVDGDRIENTGQLPLVSHIQGGKAYKVISTMHHYSNLHTYSDSADERSSSDCNSRTPGKTSWLWEPCSLSVMPWMAGRFAVFV